MEIVETACAYIELGLSPIPIKAGTKKPLCRWEPYQQRKMDLNEAKGKFAGNCQIALICGKVSDHLEILDFDRPDLFKPFCDTLCGFDNNLGERLKVFQNTPSGGYHLIYRCLTPVGGNVKLAMSVRSTGADGKPRQDVFIETRGEGGYFLVSPSSGYLLHGSLNSIPVVSSVERELLFRLARSFDENEHIPYHEKHSINSKEDLARPGDLFNLEEDWHQLLRRYGWSFSKKIGDREHWTRPGKEDGSTSATLNGRGLFVFSSSTTLPVQAPLDKFSFFTFSEFGGDFKAAARSLARSSSPRSVRTPPDPDTSGQSGQVRTPPDGHGQARTTPNNTRPLSGHVPDHKQAIAEEVKNFIAAGTGSFTNNDVYSELCIRDRRGKKTVCDALYYYENQGKITRIEGKRGWWEVVEDEPEPIDLLGADVEPVNLLLPLDISQHCRIRPGSMVLIAGASNAGKTAFLLNVVRKFFPDNVYPIKDLKDFGSIRYLNSEMSAGELVSRIRCFGDDPASWNKLVKFFDRSSGFEKLVDPNGLTIIDYLEINEDFFLSGKALEAIHRKLCKGVAVIAMQKKQGSLWAKGGEMTAEKPRLVINLDRNPPHGFIASITKLKEPADYRKSIQGMSRDFVIGPKSEILPISDWRFVNDLQRKKINEMYEKTNLPSKTREGSNEVSLPWPAHARDERQTVI